jgi:hypothetical protein
LSKRAVSRLRITEAGRVGVPQHQHVATLLQARREIQFTRKDRG